MKVPTVQREGTWESSGPEQMSEFEGSKEHLQGRGWSGSGPEPESRAQHGAGAVHTGSSPRVECGTAEG